MPFIDFQFYAELQVTSEIQLRILPSFLPELVLVCSEQKPFPSDVLDALLGASFTQKVPRHSVLRDIYFL